MSNNEKSINVKRHVSLITSSYRIEVLTPMFLGGADQNAELRAAPFRNGLRTFWRLANKQADIKLESEIFGRVHGNQASKSFVQVQVIEIRNEFYQRDYEMGLGTMQNKEARNGQVSRAAYLGMGPVHFNGKFTKTAFMPSSTFELRIRYPKQYDDIMKKTISLFLQFGALGSRARNGWGSFQATPINGSPLLTVDELYKLFGLDYKSIIKNGKKYPNALGLQNNRRCLWKIGEFNSGNAALTKVAEEYMKFKQHFPMQAGGPHDRHLLGFPLTNHHLADRNARMPSQFRIFVKRENNNVVCYLHHIPHTISSELLARFDVNTQIQIFDKAHMYLNNLFNQ